MIPRTKVNYGLIDLLRALFGRESPGKATRELERLIAERLGSGHVALTGSGRSAIRLLLMTFARPYAVAPAYTCKAVAEAIRFSNGVARWVETESNGFNMSLDAFERTLESLPIGSATVIATHQYGRPIDMPRVMEIARKRKAFVIEDAAGALGASYAGRPVGSFGDAAAFSFDSTKLLHAPLKAGAAVVRDDEAFRRYQSLAAGLKPIGTIKKLKLLVAAGVLLAIEHPTLYRLFHSRVLSRGGRFMFDRPGLKPTMDDTFIDRCADWQARIVAKQFRRLDDYVERRRDLHRRLLSALAGVRSLELPPADSANECSPVRFAALVRTAKTGRVNSSDVDSNRGEPSTYRSKLDYYRRAAAEGVDLAFSFTYLSDDVDDRRALDVADRVINPPFYHKLSEAEFNRLVATIKSLDEGVSVDEDPRSGQHDPQSVEAKRTLFEPRVLERQSRGA